MHAHHDVMKQLELKIRERKADVGWRNCRQTTLQPNAKCIDREKESTIMHDQTIIFYLVNHGRRQRDQLLNSSKTNRHSTDVSLYAVSDWVYLADTFQRDLQKSMGQVGHVPVKLRI